MNYSIQNILSRMRSEVILLIIALIYVDANRQNATLENETLSSSESSQSHSAERIKRQLFRDQIPHHRPLTGNIYAYHHGFPHRGRWHSNQQQIVTPTGQRNQNVILTDEDFNRYGSTLQHLDDHRLATQQRQKPPMIYHQNPVEYGTIIDINFDKGPHSEHHISDETHGEMYGHEHGPQTHVIHGHTIIHDTHHQHHHHDPDLHDSDEHVPVKSKPYFNIGFKIPFLFNHNKPLFNVQPLLKNLFPTKYGGGSYSSSKKIDHSHRPAASASNNAPYPHQPPKPYSWSHIA